MMIIRGVVSHRGSGQNYRGKVYGAYGPIPGMRLDSKAGGAS